MTPEKLEEYKKNHKTSFLASEYEKLQKQIEQKSQYRESLPQQISELEQELTPYS